MAKLIPTILSVAIAATILPGAATAAPLHANAFDGPGAAQPGATLEYDAANRLRRVKRGSLDIRYVYDGLGNLEAEIVDDGQKVTRTDLMLDESGPLPRIIGALTNDGAHELYAYGPMGLTMVRKNAAGQPPATYHALTDELGTVRGLADETGALAGRTAYGPFGRVRVTEGEQTKLAFTGEYRDTAGLVWLRARHYAPFLGRFLQRDTIVGAPGDPQTLNRFAYAAGNPLSKVDPSGHFAIVPVLALVALTATFLLGPMMNAVNAPTHIGDPSGAEVTEYNSKMWERVAATAVTELVSGVVIGWAFKTVVPLLRGGASEMFEGGGRRAIDMLRASDGAASRMVDDPAQAFARMPDERFNWAELRSLDDSPESLARAECLMRNCPSMSVRTAAWVAENHALVDDPLDLGIHAGRETLANALGKKGSSWSMYYDDIDELVVDVMELEGDRQFFLGGFKKDGVGHVWNLVKQNGRVIHLDAQAPYTAANYTSLPRYVYLDVTDVFPVVRQLD